MLIGVPIYNDTTVLFFFCVLFKCLVSKDVDLQR